MPSGFLLIFQILIGNVKGCKKSQRMSGRSPGFVSCLFHFFVHIICNFLHMLLAVPAAHLPLYADYGFNPFRATPVCFISTTGPAVEFIPIVWVCPSMGSPMGTPATAQRQMP